MNQTGRILFYDDTDVITDGYTVAMIPASFMYVKKSPQMLAQYVQGELLKRYPEGADALANKLEWYFADFNSPDDPIGRDEALGLYYQYRMVGSGLTVDEFYTDLHNSLESGARVNSSIIDSIKAELRARSQDLSTNLNIITSALKDANQKLGYLMTNVSSRNRFAFRAGLPVGIPQ